MQPAGTENSGLTSWNLSVKPSDLEALNYMYISGYCSKALEGMLYNGDATWNQGRKQAMISLAMAQERY